MKSTSSNLLAALALALVATSASAQVPTTPGPGISDAIAVTQNGTEIFRVTIPEAPTEPLLFVSAAAFLALGDPLSGGIVLNTTLGITVYVEDTFGGPLPTDTFFDPANVLAGDLNAVLIAALGDFSFISDIFGATADFTNPTAGLIGFGLLSDIENNQFSIGSFGLPTGLQAVHFAREPGVFDEVGNILSAQITIGGPDYKLFVFSDTEGPRGVPDGGMTLSLLGLSLTGIAFLRRKLA